ncbi:hypothetical protein LEMLEM_LOCUS27669, partial [Lemmus lemmus]
MVEVLLFSQQHLLTKASSHHWEPILTPAESGLPWPVVPSLHHGAGAQPDSRQEVLGD